MDNLDSKGREINDSTPLVLHTGVGREESMDSRITRLVAQQMDQIAKAQGLETLEEANDFDVDDSFEDDEHMSPYLTKFNEENLYVDQDETLQATSPEISDPSVEEKPEARMSKNDVAERLGSILDRLEITLNNRSQNTDGNSVVTNEKKSGNMLP